MTDNKPDAMLEARVFADHLLVPTKWLKHAVKKYKDIITIYDLAKLFGVESNVIRRRLRDEKIKLYGEEDWPKL